MLPAGIFIVLNTTFDLYILFYLIGIVLKDEVYEKPNLCVVGIGRDKN